MGIERDKEALAELADLANFGFSICEMVDGVRMRRDPGRLTRTRAGGGRGPRWAYRGDVETRDGTLVERGARQWEFVPDLPDAASRREFDGTLIYVGAEETLGRQGKGIKGMARVTILVPIEVARSLAPLLYVDRAAFTAMPPTNPYAAGPAVPVVPKEEGSNG